MNSLEPKGTKMNIDGTEREFLFTFRAINAIQEKTGGTITEFIEGLIKEENLRDPISFMKNIGLVLDATVRDDLEEGHFLNYLATSNIYQITGILLAEYGYDMPDQDEDDDPNPEERGQVNVPRMIYIGMTQLKYSEREVLNMTPRKFFLIYSEYLEMNGITRERDVMAALP